MSTAAVARFDAAQLRAAPYPHVALDPWLDPVDADEMLAWFEHQAVWQQQERSFYTQHSCFNTDELRSGPLAKLLEDDNLGALTASLERLFGLSLERSHIHVEAHRLAPGEGIGLHNDNPILGTESVRVVATFNREYDDRFGGHLVLFASDDPRDITTVIRPAHNAAVAFALGERSYHAVTDVSDGMRYSLVLGFFEVGRVPVSHLLCIEADDREDAAVRRLEDLDAIVAALTSRGAAGSPHGDGTLLDHLQGVAGLLGRWEARPALCRAGLLHSAYGTRLTDVPLFDEGERDVVRDLVGDEAERLVWLYCRVRFGDVARRDGETGYGAVTVDGADVRLSEFDVIDLNLLAWANRFAGGVVVEVDHDEWMQFGEVVGKVAHLLPAAARRDLEPLTRVSAP